MDQRPVGFIGLGRMGAGMAANLAEADVDLTVYDLRSPAMEALVASRNANVASSPAEVASAVDLLFLSLPDRPEVEDVLFGEAGVLTGSRPGLAVIDTSTIGYRFAEDIARRLTEVGLTYSDCPVSGMPFRAADGTLTMMFGGTDEVFAAAKPYLEAMGEFIVHCGGVGTGQIMKAVNNVIYDVNIAAICEVLPLAVKAGLDPDTVARVLTSGSSRSFASEYFVPRILARRFDTDFSMAAAYKDIENVQDIATRHEAATPVVNAMTATYQAAMSMGFGDEPKSAMIKVYERALGLKIRSATSDES